MSRTSSDEAGRMDRFFTAFSTLVAKWTESQKWTGSHWTFAIVGVLVVVSLIAVAVKDTNIGISIATLLMVFVLQNTQNGDSAALRRTSASWGSHRTCRSRRQVHGCATSR
jgi:low affinity Fe/Cu permease